MNDTDESYYRSLHVMERIDKELKKKKIKSSAFSRSLNKTPAWWSVKFTSIIILRLTTVKTIAEKLNVCLEYILYGKNYGPYIQEKMDLKEIPQYTNGKKLKFNDSQKSIISNIKHGKQNDIGINMFFQIEDKIKENLLKIITKD